jgi:putative protein-disulfide isomerase
MSDAAASLLYVADPMCSWCYGFAPSLRAVQLRWPELPVTVLLGGLRPAGEPLDAALRAKLRHHWDEVARRSGQPFSPAALAREGWLYTTEPACRAVVVVRETAPSQALPMFHAIQTAFYADGRDTSANHVLADLAEGLGLERAAFERDVADATARELTAQDFATAQRLGVRGFPALAVVHDGQGRLVAPGWVGPQELVARVEQALGG